MVGGGKNLDSAEIRIGNGIQGEVGILNEYRTLPNPTQLRN